MKLAILSLVGAALLVAAGGGWQDASAQPKEEPKPEALPDVPKADPKSKLIESPNVKQLYIEVLPDKSRRMLFPAEVCLREGPLEVFLCKKGTKEHEAPLRTDIDAQLLHELLILAGGESGKPTQFIDPKTEEAKYSPATGSKIKITLHYKLNGKLQTCSAQEWIWDIKKKAPIPHSWVFAGSVLVPNPNNPNAKPFYGANSGDIFSISNFPYAMLEFPVEISKDDAQLTYEAKTDKIPPLGSKVWMILEVMPAKK